MGKLDSVLGTLEEKPEPKAEDFFAQMLTAQQKTAGKMSDDALQRFDTLQSSVDTSSGIMTQVMLTVLDDMASDLAERFEPVLSEIRKIKIPEPEIPDVEDIVAKASQKIEKAIVSIPKTDMSAVEMSLGSIIERVSQEPESVKPLLAAILDELERKREWVFDVEVDLATGDPKRIRAREV